MLWIGVVSLEGQYFRRGIFVWFAN